jgi:hypothetical protein
LLAACGDDDGEAADTVAPAATEAATDTTPEPETTPPPTTAAAPETTAVGPATTPAPATSAAPATTGEPSSDQACADWIAADTAVTAFLFSGEGDADAVNAALDAAIASADGAIVDTLTELATEVQGQLADPSSDASDRTIELYDESLAWAAESCDVETIQVHGLDYHFEGIPSELTTGYKIVEFTNDGAEMHELLTIRINDGVTETIEELVELPEDEVFSKITMVNAAFAPPGVTSTVSWNLVEPGRYVTICFVPVGTVGEAPGEGPPHFTQGMVEEFTVR